MTTQSPQPAPDKIGWSDEVWQRIHAEVHHELTRARVAAKFLPTLHVPAKTLSVQADVVSLPSDPANFAPGAMTVDEGLTLRINEFWTEFVMTPAQVAHEAAVEATTAHTEHPEPTHHPHPGHDANHPRDTHHASTGITLATRAANLLAQAEDMLVMQGANALLSPLFSTPGNLTPLATSGGSPSGVSYRGIPADLGLLNLPLGTGTIAGTKTVYPPSPFTNALAPIYVQPVKVNPGLPPNYQGATVAAVATGCSMLQASGQCGPYVLVLGSIPWADTLSPLPATMILPAIPIKELVTAGFHVTGTLPPWTLTIGAPVPGPQNGLLPTLTAAAFKGKSVVYTGVLASLGGHPLDLVRCRLHHDHDALVTYEQTDSNGNLHFRIRQRFALRMKDITAVVPLLFLDS
jgi:hypothetical protein